MKRILLPLLFSLTLALPASAQVMLGGSGAPVRSVGSEGQFYFNTANGNIYGPKAFNAWPSPTIPTYPAGAAGSTLQVQYNNAGAMAGMSGTSWDNTNRSLTLTGATVTASNPVLNLSQTWNNAGVAFFGLTFNAVDTSSSVSSVLMRLSVGGSSKLNVDKAGNVTAATSFSAPQFYASTDFIGNSNSTKLRFGASVDTIITRKAAANWQFGDVDAAAPVEQTLSVQSVVAGTTNTAGAAWTQKGSLSTGSGIGGDIVFQTSAANAAATTQNAGVTILTLKGSATTTANPGRVLVAGQIESSGSPPTAAGSGGTCATDGIAGGANAGTVTLTAACAATDTVTLTFKTAATTGWTCFASDRTQPTSLLYETSTTTTTAVLTVSGATTGATDVIQYACTAY